MTTNKGGKPLKFKTVEDLERKIEEYLKWVEKERKPLTIERLACFLECDRETINNYQRKEAYFGTIKRIKNYILADKVERLNMSDGIKTGIIFDLKNNHRFADKTETEISNKSGESFRYEEIKSMTEAEQIARIEELTNKAKK